MSTVIYKAPNQISIKERPKPIILHPMDVIIRILYITICSTDLHILAGDITTGMGIINSLGAAVHNFSIRDKVLILSSTQFVRVLHMVFLLYLLPFVIDKCVVVKLSDVVPTAYECGILNGEIAPGSSIVIIRMGLIRLMDFVVVVIRRGMRRVEMVKGMGVDHAFSVLGEGGTKRVVRDAMAVSVSGRGYDVGLVGPGGTIASLGVFGCSCELRLENWHRNICLRTRLIDAVSTIDLLQMVEGGGIDPSFLVTHNFAFDDIENAYEAFEKSSKHGSLKVVVSMRGSNSVSGLNGSSANGSSQGVHP
ncbi:hypothetical protein BJX68DRAFT_277911 [Aspergillus pseudodeflectus]|uniref:Uncharacterized protein n=1 Tax=Aspergillus pseudodeflectus TaxID=176178 RepID=A0ABR4JVE5_9EURO